VEENLTKLQIISLFMQMRILLFKTMATKCYIAKFRLQMRNVKEGLLGYKLTLPPSL